MRKKSVKIFNDTSRNYVIYITIERSYKNLKFLYIFTLNII